MFINGRWLFGGIEKMYFQRYWKQYKLSIDILILLLMNSINMLNKIYVLLALALLATTVVSYQVTFDCKNCTDITEQPCFFLNGGPFNNAEIPVNKTTYSDCQDSGIPYPTTIDFNCQDNCTKQYSNSCSLTFTANGHSESHCGNNIYGQDNMTVLDIFYSVYEEPDDPTYDNYYPWCEKITCGGGFPIWAIILIAVLGGVILIVVIIVLFCCFKKKFKMTKQNLITVETVSPNVST